MKRKILAIILCVICILGLVGCSDYGDDAEGSIAYSGKYANLEIVEYSSNDHGMCYVFTDTDTGVLYLWYKDRLQYGQTLTPLYNADGSLKNVEDFAG